MRLYRVRIVRWDCYVVHHVEARSEDDAEERAVEILENTHDYEHLDGGLNLVEAELEDE